MEVHSESFFFFWLKKGSIYILGTWNHKTKKAVKSLSPEDIKNKKKTTETFTVQHLTPYRNPFHMIGTLDIVTDESLTWESPEVGRPLWWDPISHCLLPGVLLLFSFRAWPPGDNWWLLLNRKTESTSGDLGLGTQTGMHLLGHWTKLPAVSIRYNILNKQNLCISWCSRQGHPMAREKGRDSFLWEFIPGECRVPSHHKIPYSILPWPLQTSVTPGYKISWLLQIMKPALLQDTSSPTYQWRKEYTRQ